MVFFSKLQRGSTSIGRITGAVLPWVGGVLLGLAVGFAAHSWWLARGLARAQATVTENVESFAQGGGILYKPRLRFRTAGGGIVLVLSRLATDDIEFKAGKIVPVMYPRGQPQEAVIATIWRVYFAANWLAIIGTAMFDVGLVVRRSRK